MSRTVTEVDYDFIEVNGNHYLLPVHSLTNADGTTWSWKNEATFRDYRKFDVSSTLDFGAANDSGTAHDDTDVSSRPASPPDQ